MFNFSSIKESVRKLSNLVKINPDITDEDYIIKEINKFKNSIRRKQMVKITIMLSMIFLKQKGWELVRMVI